MHEENVRSLKAGVCPINPILSRGVSASPSEAPSSSSSSPMSPKPSPFLKNLVSGKSVPSFLVSPPPSPGPSAEQESEPQQKETLHDLEERWMNPFYPHDFQWLSDDDFDVENQREWRLLDGKSLFF
jgi:hypothetical protein